MDPHGSRLHPRLSRCLLLHGEMRFHLGGLLLHGETCFYIGRLLLHGEMRFHIGRLLLHGEMRLCEYLNPLPLLQD